MVVLAGEVGGRWSETCGWFVRALAAFRARASPQALRQSAEHAWQARWWAILSVATQDALASTHVNDAPRCLHGRPPHVPTLGDLLLDAEPVLSPLEVAEEEGGGASRLPLRAD